MRLRQLDGLRGILCLCVVYHHFLCGFHPCSVFGPSAEWVDSEVATNVTKYSSSSAKTSTFNNDKTVLMGMCHDQSVPNFLTEPFGNGPFAVSCFFVMSGVALSIGLLSSMMSNSKTSTYDVEKKINRSSGPMSADTRTMSDARSFDVPSQWRLAIAKRFFRLALPSSASIIFAHIVALLSEKIDAKLNPNLERINVLAAKITMSKWLRIYSPRRTPTLIGLMKQCYVGIWHGTSTMNNAIWTMPFELWGSFLIFLLVAVIPKQVLGKAMRGKRNFYVLVLLSFTMMPSPKINESIEIHLDYFIESTLKNGTRMNYDGVVTVNPGCHPHLVNAIMKKYGDISSTEFLQIGMDNDNENKGNSYNTIIPWTWSKQVENEEKTKAPRPLSIDSAKLHKIVGGSLADELLIDTDHSTVVSNFYNHEFIGTNKVELSHPRLTKTKYWGASSPFEWYSCFVIGLWIAMEYQHQLQFKRDGVTTKRQHKASFAALSLFTLLCAGYPIKFGELRVMRSPLWSSMSTVASFIGVSPSLFYHVLGAASLVWLVVIEVPSTLTSLLTSSIFSFLGKVSFGLYLTHIPILYTFTSALFVFFHNNYELSQSTSGNAAMLVSLPIMIAAASLFHKYVDEPSIKLSARIGREIAGVQK